MQNNKPQTHILCALNKEQNIVERLPLIYILASHTQNLPW